MSSNERLARFALRHIASSFPNERPAILDAAAQFLPNEEADLCRVTAQFIRHSEEHQLKLVHLFSEKL